MNYIVTTQKQPACYSLSKFNGLLLGVVFLNTKKLFEPASTCNKIVTINTPKQLF